MKYKLILLLVFICAKQYLISAQESDYDKYHRCSLYSILLKHPEKEFCNEMIEAFKSIPIPDKYNNHDLKIKVMPAPVLAKMTKEEVEGAYKDAILNLLMRNKVAGRLVEKWFNRDKSTGEFDMNLVAERGFYDASILDVKEARATARGTALLADAGEELLSHTFVIVNDIRYADGEMVKDAVGGGLLAASYVANLFSAGLAGSIISNVGTVAGTLKNAANFRVLVTSYLFRLDWNDETANNFYTNLWIDRSNADPERKEKWNGAMSNFKLNYVGSATVFSGKTALGGVKDEKSMFLKVCTRAVDKSISDLQKSFDEFKVFTPLISTEPLCAYIGLKEGVDEDSRYEVLEKTIDSNGRTRYERVGEVKPVKGQIWDNRFMAEFDKADGSDLKYTTFKKVLGKDFYPGMLIREIR